jgi:hypothetical protein
VIHFTADANVHYAMESVADVTATPMIAPFWSDLDATLTGDVYFNDFGDRAVFTWVEVGSFYNPLAPFTFQAQLLTDGGVIFGYDGISDISAALNKDVVVGISQGNGLPGVGMDDIDNDMELTRTVYTVFEHGVDAFGLDGENLVFTRPILTAPLQPLSILTPAVVSLHSERLRAGSQSAPPAPSTPEPSSVVLFCVGILIFIVISRKRLRKRAQTNRF